MAVTLMLLRVLVVVVCMPLLIPAVQHSMACMFGPSRPAPDRTQDKSPVGEAEEPRPKRGVFASLVRRTATRLPVWLEVFPRMVAVYMGFGLMTAIFGGSFVGGFGPNKSAVSALAVSPGGVNIALLVGGICSVATVRLYSVLQSTLPLKAAAFTLVSFIAVFFGLSSFPLPGTVPFLTYITDTLFQQGATEPMARIAAVMDVVMYGLVVSVVAVAATELAIQFILSRRLDAVPLSLFEEYRGSFLVHEQRYTRGGVTGLYVDSVREFATLAHSTLGWSHEGLLIQWATCSATKEIADAVAKACEADDRIRVDVVTTAEGAAALQDVFGGLMAKSKARLWSLPRRKVSCPRFMVLGGREVVAAMPLPPEDLRDPTSGSSTIGFRSDLADCIARHSRTFVHLTETAKQLEGRCADPTSQAQGSQAPESPQTPSPRFARPPEPEAAVQIGAAPSAAGVISPPGNRSTS